MYKRKNIKLLNIQEMNNLLTYVSKNYILIKGKSHSFNSRYAYFEDNQIIFSLTFKKGATVCTFKCRKDGERALQQIYGQDAFRICKQYIGKNDIFDLRTKKEIDIWKKVLVWSDIEKKFLVTTSPILYSNPKYDGKRVKAYSYDINSSYSNAMLQDMPDMSKLPKMNARICENELGYSIIDGKLICYEEVGKTCDFVFKRIESPFKRFIEVWYNRKKNATSIEEKEKAKEVLNYCVGYYQKVNPFIRSRIISYANKLIEDLIDENTLLCNTDSIVSLVPRNDLNIGKDIGQFKQENKGTLFAYKHLEYQWDLKVPSYRHISKKWFPKGWDILVDPIPTYGNLVKFNEKTGLLEEE